MSIPSEVLDAAGIKVLKAPQTDQHPQTGGMFIIESKTNSSVYIPVDCIAAFVEEVNRVYKGSGV
jgi:hypothetical protein